MQYVGWDDNPPKHADGCIAGREVIRMALSDIKPDHHPVPLRYITNPAADSMAWASSLTQDTGDEVFWAGHDGTSQLRVFSWAALFPQHRWLRHICRFDPRTPLRLRPFPMLDELTPPFPDWLFRNEDDAMVGATRSVDKIWLAWNAAFGDKELDRTAASPRVSRYRLGIRHLPLAFRRCPRMPAPGKSGFRWPGPAQK